MKRDPLALAHQEWLGFVQPVGLVVSIPALMAAEAYVNRNIAPTQSYLLECLLKDELGNALPRLKDFAEFSHKVLSWSTDDLISMPEGSVSGTEFENVEVVLTEYGETLRPTFLVPELKPKPGESPWILLVQVLENGADMDSAAAQQRHKWHASPHAKFERLLRESQIPIGLLVNGTQIRLIYAPRGETSGYITFTIANMMTVAGRPILGGLMTLLSHHTLFLQPNEKQRLPGILSESRKYQNTVSTKLSEQVLAALYELLRGFQSANDHSHGNLLREVLANEPEHVYAGLLTVLMRLVFLLFAEAQGLLSSSSTYTNFYSISGLFERLRQDVGRYPDTMDQRYGAWAQLLTVFRLIYDGGSHGDLKIPPRQGHLFDPEKYPFLEGKQTELPQDSTRIPFISDGTILRVLSNLLMLGGERLSYRTLDVEQIGSVYEAMMGFQLQIAAGSSIAIKSKKSYGAPTCVNLDDLLRVKGSERSKWIKVNTDQEITGNAANELKAAATIDDLIQSLERKIAKHATPNIVPKGSMILQPSDERRRSGSHYTPRALTGPIVTRALLPVIGKLGEKPTPEKILSIKICDPAMGSGAFLVEACRQLGDELVRAWITHQCTPPIPPEEDELLHARRLIAQRCIYGVDKNPMAVSLAKLSLWLATLAKDHQFTFLDHTLRCGDSLVGITADQIMRFHWSKDGQLVIDEKKIRRSVQAATSFRKEILESAESALYPILEFRLREADKALSNVRLIADSVVSAYFSADKDRARLLNRDKLLPHISKLLDDAKTISTSQQPPGILEDSAHELHVVHRVQSFHWEIEFPEVFDRENGGFDTIIGNPPFLGGKAISGALGEEFGNWINGQFEESNKNCDLVGFFFRKAFELLRESGTFGLIATNSIAQGDTRQSGLRWICVNGGKIFSAIKRLKWPGHAAVMVSVVHVIKANRVSHCELDSKLVPSISAYLLKGDNHENPFSLKQNGGIAFVGIYILGMGFTFDDSDPLCTSLAEMDRLIAKDARNKQVIDPYIGGEEVNDSPTHEHKRYVINFTGMTEEKARNWPDLMDIVEEKVKPERLEKAEEVASFPWWRFWRERGELKTAIANLNRVVACARHQPNWSLAFVPAKIVPSDALIVFALSDYASVGILQSRVHEVWARCFGSSIKDDLRYTPTDCFETFPFPDNESIESIQGAAAEYFSFREQLMIKNAVGLTKLYNKFHDPNESDRDIQRLRALHTDLDKAVLTAYSWDDLQLSCEFLLDYDEEDDEAEDDSGNRKKRKSWRFRWTNEIRDEVLARLLELNKRRSEAESLSGLASGSQRKKTAKSTKSKGSKKAPMSNKEATSDKSSQKQLTLAEIE